MKLEACVKKLDFIHHELTFDDKQLLNKLQKANHYLAIQRSYKDLQLDLAVEGLSIKI